MNEIQKKQIELNKELEKNVAKKDMEKEEAKLKQLERELFELNDKLTQSQKQIASVKETIDKELSSIKEFAQKTLGKTVLFEEEAY
jgi:molecular chaperone GrpE (heat shock protein)